MKKHRLIKFLSGEEYRKVHTAVSNLLNNNPNKSFNNNDNLIENYAKRLYNSNLINEYTQLKFYKKRNFFDTLRMKYIKLKYNVFNDVVSREPNQSKKVVSGYIINIIIKLLSKYYGFHKPLDFDITSTKLSAKEKWAISVFESEKIVTTHNPDFENLVKVKEKEIAEYFRRGVRHRDDDEDNGYDEFKEDIKELAIKYINSIEYKQIMYKMDKTDDFFKNYDEKNHIPKRKIFFIEFFKNLKKRFNLKWNLVKRSRAEIIILNMKERLKIIEFNDFQSNFRNLDDKHVLALYNAVNLNKRVQAIR